MDLNEGSAKPSKPNTYSLYDTGAFYQSLEDKVISTGTNRGGGKAVIGIHDKETQSK